MAVRFVGNREIGDNDNSMLFLLELDKNDVDTVIDALIAYNRQDLAGEFAHVLQSDSIPEVLHQGDLISGSGKGRNRRWIAVVLHEQEIRDACESTGVDFCNLDLDSVVEQYTEALLGDGGWYESLKTIVAEQGEAQKEEDEEATDTDFEEYATSNNHVQTAAATGRLGMSQSATGTQVDLPPRRLKSTATYSRTARSFAKMATATPRDHIEGILGNQWERCRAAGRHNAVPRVRHHKGMRDFPMVDQRSTAGQAMV